MYDFIKHILAQMGIEKFDIQPYNITHNDVMPNEIEVTDPGIYFLVTGEIHKTTHGEYVIYNDNAKYEPVYGYDKDGYSLYDAVPYLNYFEAPFTSKFKTYLLGGKQTIQFIRVIPKN